MTRQILLRISTTKLHEGSRAVPFGGHNNLALRHRITILRKENVYAVGCMTITNESCEFHVEIIKTIDTT
jgi:hypothetical protein